MVVSDLRLDVVGSDGDLTTKIRVTDFVVQGRSGNFCGPGISSF